MWLSLVERCVRDAEAAGSNPVIPIQYFQGFEDLQPLIFYLSSTIFLPDSIYLLNNHLITQKALYSIVIFTCQDNLSMI